MKNCNKIKFIIPIPNKKYNTVILAHMYIMGRQSTNRLLNNYSNIKYYHIKEMEILNIRRRATLNSFYDPSVLGPLGQCNIALLHKTDIKWLFLSYWCFGVWDVRRMRDLVVLCLYSFLFIFSNLSRVCVKSGIANVQIQRQLANSSNIVFSHTLH